MSEHVGIGRLKARLSEYVSRARAGEDVVVTDRGTPVARLVPLEGRVALEGRADDLVRGGLARRPSRPVDLEELQADRLPDPDGRSLDAVLEERAEGW